MTILKYIIFWIIMSLLCVSLLLFVEHTAAIHREQRKSYPLKVIILYSLGFWYILIPIAYIDWLENEFFRKRRKR